MDKTDKQWRRRPSKFRLSLGRWRLPVLAVLIVGGAALWVTAMINLARHHP